MKSWQKNLGYLGGALALVFLVGLVLRAPHPQPGRVSTNAFSVLVDGSSTVGPITSAVAEEFSAEQSNVQVSVGISGTGGGFRRFCPGETDLSDASRPIKGSELERCAANQVTFIELPVAFDGLTVAVDREQQIWPQGTPVCLTRGELARLWALASEGDVLNWSDVRPDLTDHPITITGAAETSGTRDFLIEALGVDAQREDGFFTEDDQLLAQQIGQDAFGVTYFGFAFFLSNADTVQAVAIDPRDVLLDDSVACDGVLPSLDTIASFEYGVFSRPLFLYVNATSANHQGVQQFVDFYLSDAILPNENFVADLGYVALPQEEAILTRRCWEKRVEGTVFSGAETGLTTQEILQRKHC